MIDLDPASLSTVRSLVAGIIPDCEVRVIGSRVNGKARQFSDLDLVVMGPCPADPAWMERLKDALSDSDIPCLVDIIDWSTVAPEFAAAVGNQYEVLQSGPSAST